MEFFIYEARRAEIIVIKPLKQNHRNPDRRRGWHYCLRYYLLPTKIDIEPKTSFIDLKTSKRTPAGVLFG